MRVPLKKIYRAFPELDRFSDPECEGFVRKAKQTHVLSMIFVAIGAIVVCLGTIVGGVILLVFVVGHIANVFWGGRVPASYEMPLMGLCLMLPVLTGLLLTFSARDVWLRWAISKRLLGTSCLSCGYSLLGLAVLHDAVTCPECGAGASLKARGLTAADILSPSMSVSANPAALSPSGHTADPHPSPPPRSVS